jgi:hypothetical protein
MGVKNGDLRGEVEGFVCLGRFASCPTTKSSSSLGLCESICAGPSRADYPMIAAQDLIDAQ